MNKKFVIVLAGVLAIAACKEESKQDAVKTVDYALISGKATNYSGLLQLNNAEGTHELKIDDNGIFRDTIRLSNPQEYTLLNAVGQSAMVYLYPGADLSITFNGDNFEKGVEFSGDGAKETNYLIEKEKLLYSYDWFPKNPGEEQKDTHEEVVANLEKRHEKMLNQLESSKGLSDAFKDDEKKRLDYTLLNSLSNYRMMTERPPNEDGHILPENYRNEIANLSLDKEADYRLSKNYRSLVSNNIMTNVMQIMQQGEVEDLFEVELNEIKKIQNEYIRNAVGYLNAEGTLLASDVDIEELKITHDKYMAFATDENRKKQFLKVYESKLANARGRFSPKFIDYENYEGGTTSLDDLKGKYVYIDVWATWCSPCIAEIPFLEKLEKRYEDKNITFVSISVDSKRDYEKWKAMIKDKNMGGVQLLADNIFDSEFVKAYNIYGIPRFIALDPEGKIISANAPRPSELVDSNWMEEQGI